MKTIHLFPDGAGLQYLQSLYLRRSTMTLIPNIAIINEQGELLFETNTLGLRGPEPQPGECFGIVWGASDVFSMQHCTSWPELIDDGTLGCRFLNGGVEGSNYRQILKRALDTNRNHPAALNVIFLGWNDFPDNHAVQFDLENALGELPNAVLVTQPTSLNATIANQDIRAHFRAQLGPEHYGFWADYTYSVELQHAFYVHITQRNEIVRAVATRTDTPLIDLFAILDSSRLDDFRKYFFDVGHPRPAMYPTIAGIVREAVRPLLLAASAA